MNDACSGGYWAAIEATDATELNIYTLSWISSKTVTTVYKNENRVFDSHDKYINK